MQFLGLGLHNSPVATMRLVTFPTFWALARSLSFYITQWLLRSFLEVLKGHCQTFFSIISFLFPQENVHILLSPFFSFFHFSSWAISPWSISSSKVQTFRFSPSFLLSYFFFFLFFLSLSDFSHREISLAFFISPNCELTNLPNNQSTNY